MPSGCMAADGGSRSRRFEFAQVHSDAPEWRGAAAGGRAHAAAPASAPLADAALVVSDEAAGLQGGVQDWNAWLPAMTAIDRTLERLARGLDRLDSLLAIRDALSNAADRIDTSLGGRRYAGGGAD